MPSKKASVKNEKQYEALKDNGMSTERAAKIANSRCASKHGGEKSHSGSGKSNRGGTTAQHRAAGLFLDGLFLDGLFLDGLQGATQDRLA